MGNNINDINKIINYGYRKKYQYLNMEISNYDIKKYNGYVILYVIKEDCMRFWIIEKYFFPLVKNIKRFKNLIKDDSSVTYLLYLNENQEELIYSIHYLYYFNFDIMVKSKHLEQILAPHILEKAKDGILYQKYFENYNELVKTYKIDVEKQFKNFKSKYIKPIIINYAKAEFISYNYMQKSNKDVTELYDLFDKLVMELLNVKKSDLRHSSELHYLKKFRDYFPDTIYQYKTEWLGKQSLDLFIPSKNVGIEIQGTQHYKPVEFFGGEKQFKKQKELDLKKEKLCIENNITLFYINNNSDVFNNDNIDISKDTNFDTIIEKIINIK